MKKCVWALSSLQFFPCGFVDLTDHFNFLSCDFYRCEESSSSSGVSNSIGEGIIEEEEDEEAEEESSKKRAKEDDQEVWSLAS